MGWFTNNSKQWELRVGWICFLAIVFPFVFPPIAMLYMGIRSKIRSLIYASILWTSLYLIGYGSYFMFGDTSKVEISIFIILLSGALVVAFYLKEYLRRVHLGSIIKIKWNTSYDYIDFMRRKEISEVLSVSDFINHLMQWQQQIKNDEVRGSIFTMIHLTKSMTVDNKHHIDLFIERHAYSIENMLQQYYQIELSKLNNEVIKSAEQKIRTTLLVAIEAFENELNKKVQYQHLAIEVDSEVYIQDLKNKGLL